MKKIVTISISIPEDLRDELDMMSKDMKVSRSSTATALLSMMLKFMYSKEHKKAFLNALYGKESK